NQSYQRNRPTNQDQMITTVGGFVDAYNDSLFAKVLFNWTVDEQGMTFDTRLFDTFTTGVSDDFTFSLVSELTNLTDLLMVGINGIVLDEDADSFIDFASLISQDVVNSVFDFLGKSQIITTVIPLVANVALNSDIIGLLLEDSIPTGMLNVSDIDWKNEIENLQKIANSLFESGVIDKLFIENEPGKIALRNLESNAEIVDFINDVVYADNFKEILDVFRVMDESKLLSRTVPALINYVIESDDNGEIKQFLPLSWDQLNEISWGYECYVLFDFLHSAVTLDEDFLNAIFVQTGMLEDPEENYPSLTTLVVDYVDDFSALLVGKMVDGELVNIDKYGHTIVFDSEGNRIAGRNYSLFDMNLISMALTSLTSNLFELEFFQGISENLNTEDLEAFQQVVAALNSGNRIVNYKTEFSAILDIVATIAKDKPLLDALMSDGGFDSLMSEPGNFLTLDKIHIT
ncbi:MAG: hypothetical protein GX807_03890, partial [Erysipelotrichia bacterium]|nr:hypothetical protein [Erysipelotrichia bacterium]